MSCAIVDLTFVTEEESKRIQVLANIGITTPVAMQGFHIKTLQLLSENGL